MIRPLTPLEFKQRAVRLFGNKIGVVDGARRFTYAEYGERCDRLANALLTRGLERGDRVAVMAFNSHPLLESYFGVVAAGGVLLPLNIRLHAAELARILDHAGARFLLVDVDLAHLLTVVEARLTCAPDVIWIGQPPAGRGEPEYETLLQQASTTVAAMDIDENDVAELFYTSGTTGTPRGVMLTHRNLYLHAMSMLVTFRAAESDVQLHTIPLFHVNGWGAPQGITAVGATHVMVRTFDAGEVLRLIEAERVTRVFVVPTMLNMLLEHPDVTRRDLSSLDLVNAGGAPIPPELVRRAEQVLGCAFVGGYGLSETSPLLALALDKTTLADQGSEARVRRQASAGLPVVGTELTIVDADGCELPWDGQAVGEVVVRSNVVTAGYWADSQATAHAMRGGWFHTGDLATIDAEGYLLIVDRKKDIIISGGENLSSVQIEEVLYAHPAVLECAVLATPHPRWGEVPRAVVALRPGAQTSEQALIEHCRRHLAGFKVPTSVEFRSELPKSGSGKILKRQLRGR